MQRLDKYMTYKGLNDNKVTVQCGLSKGLIGQARTGKSDLGPGSVDKILKRYQDLNRVWLMTGEGEMLVEQPRDGLSGTVDLSSHHVSGGGNVVASGSATVQQTGTNSAVTEMLTRQNEMLARQNEMLMKSIDRLTQQLGMLMQERTTAKRDDNNYNEPTSGK